MIQAKNLHHTFKDKTKNTAVLKDVNFNIEKNEFISIIGPSGCGKTTTMRMVAGLEDPTEGDILIDGKRVNDLEPDEQLAIGLNGEDLDLVDAQRPGRRQTVARGMHVASWTYEGRELGPNPGIWLECELGANLPRRGDNIVTIRRRQGGCAPVRVVQVELPVRYEYCGRPCSVEEPSL